MTTEERIAQLAQGFGQGIQNFQQQRQAQEQKQLQAEANRRQMAIQNLEAASKLSEITGKAITPEIAANYMAGNLDPNAIGGLGFNQKYQKALADSDLDRRYKESQIHKNYNPRGQRGSGGQDGQSLKPNEIAKFNEGNYLPGMLEDLGKSINANKDIFGPVAGMISSMNPYNERSKTLSSQIEAASQAVGKYLEGGVLRAEDVPKYKKMLPNNSDTPEIAANKLATVQRLLISKQNSDLQALKGAGYDTSSIDRGLVTPQMPSVLGGLSKHGANEAQASSGGMPWKKYGGK